MTFQPVLPWPILTVVAGALVLARVVALRQVLLSSRGRGTRAVLRWSGMTLAVLLVIAAAARPALRDDRTRGGTTAAAGENLNVFLIVDRSVESDAMPGMRDDIAAFITRYPAARYALIDFATRATLDWPLSDDVWSLRPTIAALNSYRGGPSAGLDIDVAAASNVLRYQLIQAAQQHPGTRNVVLYFGSGAPGSRAPQGDFTSGSVDGGVVLGYGATDAINEAELRKVAGQLVVPYQHREPGQPLQSDLPDRPSAAHTRAEGGALLELYWPPALLAAVLLLSEIYLSVREFRRNRLTRRHVA